MSGFGGFPYGGRQFGGIRATPMPPVPVSLFVQPKIGLVNDPILIASVNSMRDASRDDDFSAGFDVLKWTDTIYGTVTTGGGLTVELNKSMAGSSFSLDSIDTYVSGDVSMSYEILSEYLSDVPAGEIVYVGMAMNFVNGNSLTIKRKLQPGFNGHSIQVEYIADGVFTSGATILSNAAEGSFRLIKHNSTLAAVADGILIFSMVTNPAGDFNVEVFSTTNGLSEYAKVAYKAYKSNMGILFGSVPMIVSSAPTATRILGSVPRNSVTGSVDVQTFNHTGETGVATDGFEYLLVLGQKLSGSAGFNGYIQNDSSIR